MLGIFTSLEYFRHKRRLLVFNQRTHFLSAPSLSTFSASQSRKISPDDSFDSSIKVENMSAFFPTVTVSSSLTRLLGLYIQSIGQLFKSAFSNGELEFTYKMFKTYCTMDNPILTSSFTYIIYDWLKPHD